MIHSQTQHLYDFLCQRHGEFDAQMQAWLHCIGSDDEATERIELETGHLPPALQLAQHCAEQVLKAEMADKLGFARDFLDIAQGTCASLQSRYLRSWIVALMDYAQSQASMHAAKTAMAELLGDPSADTTQSAKSGSSSIPPRSQ